MNIITLGGGGNIFLGDDGSNISLGDDGGNNIILGGGNAPPGSAATTTNIPTTMRLPGAAFLLGLLWLWPLSAWAAMVAAAMGLAVPDGHHIFFESMAESDGGRK